VSISITWHVLVLYSHIDALIDYIGEVSLRQVEGYKFEEWGLELWVRFRDREALAILSAQRNSGGERAVSTMLFMMALQVCILEYHNCVNPS